MKVKKIPYFDNKDCISCSICVQACPVSALSLSLLGKSLKYKNYYPVLNGEKCIGCGLCVNSCPMDCIEMGALYEGGGQ